MEKLKNIEKTTVIYLTRSERNFSQLCISSHSETHPHVELQVARHHQNVRNRVNRAELVQQTKIGASFGWKEWVEGLLMEQIINVAAGLVGTRISSEGEENLCVIQLKL